MKILTIYVRDTDIVLTWNNTLTDNVIRATALSWPELCKYWSWYIEYATHIFVH